MCQRTEKATVGGIEQDEGDTGGEGEERRERKDGWTVEEEGLGTTDVPRASDVVRRRRLDLLR